MAFLEYIPRDVLFHYTSAEGFHGIVESKKLWLSDARHSNDPREIVYGLGRIRPVLESIVDGEPARFATLQTLLNRTYKYLGKSRFFTCCFSPKGDSLPMWRTYAKNGDGVSLGFRPRAIFGLRGRILKVDYFPEAAQDKNVDEALKVALLEIMERAERYRGQMTLEQSIGFATEIASRCMAIKHLSWSYEEEVRCLYAQSEEADRGQWKDFPTSHLSDEWRVGPFKTLEREGAGGTIQYHSFEFGKETLGNYDYRSAISRVIVGPKSSLSVPEVKAILYSEGFENFEIRASECAWR